MSNEVAIIKAKKGDSLKPIIETAKAFGYECRLTRIEEKPKEEHKPVEGTCETCPYFISIREDVSSVKWGKCMKYDMAAVSESHSICESRKAEMGVQYENN